MFNTKIKLAVLIVILTVVIFIVVKPKITNQVKLSSEQRNQSSIPSQITQDDKPQIVATKPEPLEEAIITASEVVEITFNRPLENVGEFKVRIEPEIDYKVELSSDRKKAKIIPAKPYNLGTTYTLFIGTETKFDGVGRWGEEKIYHFKTIKYTGV